MNPKEKDLGVNMHIRANNFRTLRKAIDKLPKIQGLSITYSSRNTSSVLLKSKRATRLKKIKEYVDNEPYKCYTTTELRNLLADFGVTNKTIIRDVSILALQKELVIETLNLGIKGRMNVCAKNEEIISNYKKLQKQR